MRAPAFSLAPSLLSPHLSLSLSPSALIILPNAIYRLLLSRQVPPNWCPTFAFLKGSLQHVRSKRNDTQTASTPLCLCR